MNNCDGCNGKVEKIHRCDLNDVNFNKHLKPTAYFCLACIDANWNDEELPMYGKGGY